MGRVLARVRPMQSWWLRLRQEDGVWRIVDQTQDTETVARWDDEIDIQEDEGEVSDWIVLVG